ncbi:MAG: DUF2188 domain-containing protein [Planctomycetes bacterium]|nr:DUF2188 domain-containing protein [Planctomycetota bacterium]
MKSTFATELFVKLFGELPRKRVEPQPVQPPPSGIMVPNIVAAPGERVVYHVTPRRGDSRWNVKKEGGSKPSAVCDTKELAIEAARGFAHNLALAQVIIHNKDGKVSQEYSYGTPTEPRPTTEPEPAKPVGDWNRETEDETEVDRNVQDS